MLMDNVKEYLQKLKLLMSKSCNFHNNFFLKGYYDQSCCISYSVFTV